MAKWIELGGGWTWTNHNGDGNHNRVWLRHQCASDKQFTACASVSHTVVSREPLTLSPSVICECGAHGFITDGRWQGV